MGLKAHVYESVAELKGIGAGFGLAANAMQALDHLGLKDEISQIGHYLGSYNVLDQKGNILVEPNPSVKNTIRTILRYTEQTYTNFFYQKFPIVRFTLANVRLPLNG
ncbi:hypothetical protein D3C76_1529170 [compost metagenome]